jgi:D-arabinose 1-dehydrogenase-like Zn-dependent alcohol dehydrogenase
VAACGICGSDVHFLEGMPVPGGLPFTLGHEPAGIVETIGAGVRDWQPGDRVALHLGAGCGTCRVCVSGHPNCCPHLVAPGLHIDGAFAEAIRVPVGTLVRVPDAVSLVAAALSTDCVASPYHALKCRAGLRPGERVAVIGCGGLGSQAVCLARVLGAGQVVAVDISAVALERAARAGATDCVDASKVDAASAIRDVTGGGADVVIECVGTPETVAAGVRALLPGGRLVAVGVGMMPLAVDLPQAIFALQELAVLGSFGSHQADLQEIFRLEAAGVICIEASVSHRLRLDQVAEGLDMLRTKRGDPQRIVVEMATG